MSERSELRFQIQVVKMAIERWTDEIDNLKAKLDEYEAEKAKLTQKLEKLEKEFNLKSGSL